MSQSRGLVLILCLVLATSCVQAWNFGYVPYDRIPKAGESPWLVSVMEICSSSIGGGSLISKYVVLTAWKVIENRNASQLAVRIENGLSLTDVRVQSVVQHPNFDQTTGANNLALLFLKKPIEFNTKIAPINLATGASMRNLDLTSCFVEGFTKKTFPIPVVETTTCQQELRHWLGASFTLDDSLLCAGGGIERNFCEGDGYPLVCPLARDPSHFQLVGIINWHINCGEYATPDVYTNVARLHGWIYQQIILNRFFEDPEDNEEEIECSDGEKNLNEIFLSFFESEPTNGTLYEKPEPKEVSPKEEEPFPFIFLKS